MPLARQSPRRPGDARRLCRADEGKRLEELRSELGFDPCARAHELRDKRRETRDAKRVLEELVQGDIDRELEPLRRLRVEELARRAEHTGLAAFLEEATGLCDEMQRGEARVGKRGEA